MLNIRLAQIRFNVQDHQCQMSVSAVSVLDDLYHTKYMVKVIKFICAFSVFKLKSWQTLNIEDEELPAMRLNCELEVVYSLVVGKGSTSKSNKSKASLCLGKKIDKGPSGERREELYLTVSTAKNVTGNKYKVRVNLYYLLKVATNFEPNPLTFQPFLVQCGFS